MMRLRPNEDMATVYIGIGSNLGDRPAYIKSAIMKIKKLPSASVKKISSTIESAPQGGPEQGPYLNSVIEITTDFTPHQLLRELQKIESELGRLRTVVNGPRTIDLDILLYGDICINEQALNIPHPRILERDFVLYPLKEIAPDLVAALLKKSAKGEIQK
ncbi:MAG: 2-amino-4-hydroxy-6-hydroxymethyldihydropteridine diphosphokinase [Candidatus Omnitrophota bacterium]